MPFLGKLYSLQLFCKKVFKGLTTKGKSSMDRFFAWKLHFIVNDYCEILSFQLTPGNVSDLTPVKELAK